MVSLMATILISNQVFLGASEGAAVRRGYTLAIYSAGLSGLDGDSFSEYEGF